MEKKYDYFYSGQIRRFLNQICKGFSGLVYETGYREGIKEQPLIPCYLATKDRQVAHILRKNSENVVLTIPQITVEVQDVKPIRANTQVPSLIKQDDVSERLIDKTTGTYSTEQGLSYSVLKPMAHPLNLTFTINIWTSNELQKHQIFEQIYSLFNVGFDIQNSDNPLDWTALTLATLQDINWSSRTFPLGTADEIDILTLTFLLPMWIQPPVKKLNQQIVHQVNNNINQASEINHNPSDPDMNFDMDEIIGSQEMYQQFVSPGMHRISVEGNELKLLGPTGLDKDENGNIYEWEKLIAFYGNIQPPYSNIRIKTTSDVNIWDSDIIGIIDYHPNEKNKLLWVPRLATLPDNTLQNITAIIDPLKTFPGDGKFNFSSGDRFMILEDISENAIWGFKANTNDIIEFNGTNWIVSFDSKNEYRIQYVTNLYDNKQLKFTGKEWVYAIDGIYDVGFWRIRI
jgi:hypothetical protein